MQKTYTDAHVRRIVEQWYESHGRSYAAVARCLDVNVSVVWRLLARPPQQLDSPTIRARLNLPRPKVYKMAITFKDQNERDRFRSQHLQRVSFGQWVRQMAAKHRPHTAATPPRSTRGRR